MADDFAPKPCAECEELRAYVAHAERRCLAVERETIQSYAAMWYADAKAAHAKYREASDAKRKAEAKLARHVEKQHAGEP